MKILYYGYAANNHSWGIVAQNLSRQMIKKGHHVDIFSTNTINHLPSDLKTNVIGHHDLISPGKNPVMHGKKPSNDYDMAFSYTLMPNFFQHLQYAKSNKFGIWCYEWENFIPIGYSKHHEICDVMFPPSTNSFNIFKKAGVPESKMTILPHGVDESFYKSKDLKLSNKTKYLSVFASNDSRKNIQNMFKVWCEAFNKSDNVLWVIKTSKKSFQELDSIYKLYKSQYKNIADVKIMTDYMDNIQDIYKSCDIYYSLSRCEGFLMPALEAVLSNMPVISSNYGGQLDYLNDDNSFLVNGKMVYTPKGAAYYAPTNYTAKPMWFDPDLNEAFKILKESKASFKDKKELMKMQHEEYKEKYSWEKIATTMLGKCK